jgi:hypothetical protein
MSHDAAMSGRPMLKRAALWTAAFVVLVVWYVGAAPFVAFMLQRYLPASKPIFDVVYAPLVYIAKTDDAPGHDLFLAYAQQCDALVREVFP